MKVYSPSEVAELLGIKQPTLRKYSGMLEERRYHIERNSQKHRYYRDEDIVTLRRVITGSKSGVTLEESINNVLSIQNNNTSTNAINSGNESPDSDVKELKEMIQALTDKVDQQQDYINDHIKKRDKAISSH